MKCGKKVLITASSFPFYEGSTKGNFILEYAQVIGRYHNVCVLTHGLGGLKRRDNICGVDVVRYNFLPFESLSKHFDHGVLRAFGSNKLLLVFIAPLYMIAQLLAIRRLDREMNLDVIHAHWIIPQGLIAVIYKMLFNSRLAVVSTVHGGDIFAFKGKLGTRLKRWVVKKLDAITVVSHHIKAQVVELDMHKEVVVLPMGVNMSKFNPSNYCDAVRQRLGQFDSVILFVGRLSEKKGVTYLIDAMKNVLEQSSKVGLVIAGDGELREELDRQVNALGLERNVVFLGNVPHDDLPSWFATADVFVGPSIVAQSGDSEGFGLVFVEAAASGTVVITTDFESMRDIITHDQSGLVVRQKSSTDIEEAILSLLRNSDKKKMLELNARNHVLRSFSWEVIGEKYAQLLNSL